MKILIAYYSRTGTTASLAKDIAQQMGTTVDPDLDKIIDKKPRTGLFGLRYILAGRDARIKASTDIDYNLKPENYTLILVGTPVWAGNLPPAPRTYLQQHTLSGKQVGFFCTSAGNDRTKVFQQLRDLTPHARHLGSFGLTTKEVKARDYTKELNSFLKTIRKE